MSRGQEDKEAGEAREAGQPKRTRGQEAGDAGEAGEVREAGRLQVVRPKVRRGRERSGGQEKP